MLILEADRTLKNSDRIREMLETSPAFCGISGAIDNFVIPENSQLVDCDVDSSILLDTTGVDVPHQLNKKSRKRRRILADDIGPVEIQHPWKMRAAELIPLQQAVLEQQLVVFSAQLQLIEEQREYYQLKLQRLL